MAKSELAQIVSIPELERITKVLSEATPKKFIYKREGPGGKVLDYVSIGYVQNKLNEAFGPMNWSTSVREVSTMEMIAKTGQIVVAVKLELYGGKIFKEQYGSSDIKFFKNGDKAGKPVDIGNDFKSAASDGLKKCASMFGVASDVYFKDWGAIDSEREKATGNEGVEIPTGANLEDEALTRGKNEVFTLMRSKYSNDKERMKAAMLEAVGIDTFAKLTMENVNALKAYLA